MYYIYKALRDDEILYIGITDNMRARMGQHKSKSRWWGEHTNILFMELPNRYVAKNYETYMINKHMPEYNRAEKVGYNIDMISFHFEEKWNLYNTSFNEKNVFKCVQGRKKKKKKLEKKNIDVCMSNICLKSFFYNLSLLDVKLVVAMLSKVSFDDLGSKEYWISQNDLLRTVGLANKKTVIDYKRSGSFESLKDRCLIKCEDIDYREDINISKIKEIPIFNKTIYEDSKLMFKINPDFKKNHLHLNVIEPNHPSLPYTVINTGELRKFRSPNVIKLYLIMLVYLKDRRVSLKINIKTLFNALNYTSSYSKFRLQVVPSARINFMDNEIDFEIVKEQRKEGVPYRNPIEYVTFKLKLLEKQLKPPL